MHVVGSSRRVQRPSSLQHGGNAVLDGKALACLRTDQVAVDDLNLEQHMVQRLEEAIILGKVGGHGRRQ